MMDENLTYSTDVPNFGLNSFNDDALDENHENDIIFSEIKLLENNIPRRRKPFSKQEDSHLLSLVKKYGTNDWKKISLNMDGRSTRQCRDRYQLYLCETIKKKEKWTFLEDELLLAKYKLLGPQWKLIASFFKGRNMYMIKNRFRSLSKKGQYPNKFNSQKEKIQNQTSAVKTKNSFPLNSKEDISNDFTSMINDFSSDDFDNFFQE